MKTVILCLCLSLVSSPVIGSIIITSMEAKKHPSWGYNEIKLTWITTPGPDDNKVIVDSMEGTYGAIINNGPIARCEANVGAGPSELFPNVDYAYCIPVYSGMTWKDTEKVWNQTHPGGVGVIKDYELDGCYIFGFAPHTALASELKTNGTPSCIKPPPTPDPKCKVDDIPPIEVTTGAGDVNVQAVRHGRVACEVPASIVLMSSDGKSSIKYPWGRADIRVNGALLPAKLRPDPIADFTVEANITGQGATAGVYEGALVLVVGYQ